VICHQECNGLVAKSSFICPKNASFFGQTAVLLLKVSGLTFNEMSFKLVAFPSM
jgi:hypothetical protein